MSKSWLREELHQILLKPEYLISIINLKFSIFFRFRSFRNWIFNQIVFQTFSRFLRMHVEWNEDILVFQSNLMLTLVFLGHPHIWHTFSQEKQVFEDVQLAVVNGEMKISLHFNLNLVNAKHGPCYVIRQASRSKLACSRPSCLSCLAQLFQTAKRTRRPDFWSPVYQLWGSQRLK